MPGFAVFLGGRDGRWRGGLGLSQQAGYEDQCGAEPYDAWANPDHGRYG